jgi:hypothetical protein
VYLIYAETAREAPPPIPEPLASGIFSPPLPVHIKLPPKIDGSGDDPQWSNIPYYIVKIDGENREIEVRIKTCRNEKTFFMLIQFPESLIVEKQKTWKWDKEKKIYVPGIEIENSLTLLFFKDSIHTNSADVWIWRAARTNIAGYADDMVMLGNSYQMDKGKSCWFSKFFGEFAGSELPRFYQRTPTGSAGDVKAKGKWKNKMMTIEFARKLKTGHTDDFILNRKLSMKLIIQSGRK